ncbi:hypothetical protein B0A53_03640 [Rhodotorula sp. CCFEE 5036]|nr:hypothetical protein B0A53_03640 [Rhodotorula sp. CCFEE 5036]
MPHPALRKSNIGRKGPRQVTGKRQVKGTLRPGPVAGPSRNLDEDGGDLDDDEQEGAGGHGMVYGYREALIREGKPLSGCKVSVSGCTAIKEDLWAVAVEYGAERHPGLLADTTHLVAETHDSEKYRVAMQLGIPVLKPSWLWAVRAAWVSGEPVNYQKLEDEHRLPPLAGVVACLTRFARGPYRDSLKAELVRHGATVISQLTNKVTHLIVASPYAPHSQTPPSEKLMQAQRNAHHLRPGFVVVWEGWVQAAISSGGVRPEDAAQYRWQEIPSESQYGKDEAGLTGLPEPRRPGTDVAGAAGLVPDLAPTGIANDRRELSTAEPRAKDPAPSRAVDGFRPDANGTTSDSAMSKPDDARLLKKRRISNRVQDRSDLDVYAAWGVQSAGVADLAAPPSAANTNCGDATAATTVAATANLSSRRAAGTTDAAGTVIRALGERRNDVWSRGGRDHQPQEDHPNASTSSLTRHLRASADNENESGAPQRARCDPIFDGQSFALVNLKGPDPFKLAGQIARYGGNVEVNPAEDVLAAVDWIVVDYAEPDEAFFRSSDQRVVSICWLELCIHFNTLLVPSDRLLERPLPYVCPVPGAEAICAHFSGYSEASPVLHHIRRFLSAIGATFSRQLTRRVTHLVVGSLDEDSADPVGAVPGSNPAKVAKAREWEIPIVSLRTLREEVDELAGRQENTARRASSANLLDVTNSLEKVRTPPPSSPPKANTRLASDESPDSSRRSCSPEQGQGDKPRPEEDRLRDPAESKAVLSPVAPPAGAPQPASRSEPELLRATKGLLRQQTSLLLAKLSDPELGPALEAAKPRAVSARARGQPREPLRAALPRLSPPVATQEEDASLRIDYDDSEQAAARAQILKSLAEDTPGAASHSDVTPPPPARHARSVRQAAGRSAHDRYDAVGDHVGHEAERSVKKQAEAAALLYGAQLDLIAHKKSDAMTKLEASANLGSSTACSILANLLACGWRDEILTPPLPSPPNLGSAAALFIRGLEIELLLPSAPTNRETQHASDSTDDGDEQDLETASFNLERTLDLLIGIADSHRFGILHAPDTACLDQGTNSGAEPTNDGLWCASGRCCAAVLARADISKVLFDGPDSSSIVDSWLRNGDGLHMGESVTNCSPGDPAYTQRCAIAIVALYVLALQAWSSSGPSTSSSPPGSPPAEKAQVAQRYWHAIGKLAGQFTAHGGLGNKAVDELVDRARYRLEATKRHDLGPSEPWRMAKKNGKAARSSMVSATGTRNGRSSSHQSPPESWKPTSPSRDPPTGSTHELARHQISRLVTQKPARFHFGSEDDLSPVGRRLKPESVAPPRSRCRTPSDADAGSHALLDRNGASHETFPDSSQPETPIQPTSPGPPAHFTPRPPAPPAAGTTSRQGRAVAVLPDDAALPTPPEPKTTNGLAASGALPRTTSIHSFRSSYSTASALSSFRHNPMQRYLEGRLVRVPSNASICTAPPDFASPDSSLYRGKGKGKARLLAPEGAEDTAEGTTTRLGATTGAHPSHDTASRKSWLSRFWHADPERSALDRHRSTAATRGGGTRSQTALDHLRRTLDRHDAASATAIDYWGETEFLEDDDEGVDEVANGFVAAVPPDAALARSTDGKNSTLSRAQRLHENLERATPAAPPAFADRLRSTSGPRAFARTDPTQSNKAPSRGSSYDRNGGRRDHTTPAGSRERRLAPVDSQTSPPKAPHLQQNAKQNAGVAVPMDPLLLELERHSRVGVRTSHIADVTVGQALHTVL